MTPRNGHVPPAIAARFHQLLSEARAEADLDYRRGMIAMRLAPDLETCRALLRGEQVSPSRLDREYLARLRHEGLQL